VSVHALTHTARRSTPKSATASSRS
jgi:hypothetical protein